MNERKKLKRSSEFGEIYKLLCGERGVSPQSMVQAHLPEKRLKFCCDYLDNQDDWTPALNALAADRSLVEIHIYSRHRRKEICENIDTEEKLARYRSCRKTNTYRPIIYTNYLLKCFVDAVAICTRDSTNLTSLILDGIPLEKIEYLRILCAGLSLNKSLQRISLSKCSIGDEGCDLFLRACAQNPDLRMIDLSSCELTSKSAGSIVVFLQKRRDKLLANISNKFSKRKNPNSYQDLRTLVLDNNRKFGDTGFHILVGTLKSDLWLESMSLQGCGLGRASRNVIRELLATNRTLISIDFETKKLPTEKKKTPKHLFARKPTNGQKVETLKSRSRIIDRKTDFMRNRLRSIGKIASRDQQKHRRLDKRSNLRELKEHLSNLIDCNHKLQWGLANKRLLLVREKHSRMRAEKSYQLMTPIIEKLRSDYREQNQLGTKIRLENFLCTDIRKIFSHLEDISTINLKIARESQPGKKHERGLVVKKFSIDLGDKKKILAPKRPHCPPY